MGFQSKPCRECGKDFIVSPRHLRKSEYVCFQCRARYERTPEARKRKNEWARERRKQPDVRQRDLARGALNRAVRRGEIERGPCEICATREDIHAHHTDYSRPLDVVWLCREHHRIIHLWELRTKQREERLAQADPSSRKSEQPPSSKQWTQQLS